MRFDEMEEMLLPRDLYQRLWQVLEDLESVLWEIKDVSEGVEED